MARIVSCCLLQLLLTYTTQVFAGSPQLTTEHDKIIYTLLNQPLELVCSSPINVSIAWYHNNVPFPTSTTPSGPQPAVYNNTLVFPPLREEDNGWYTCAASNEYGRDEIDFLVIVGEPATITFQLPGSRNIVVQEGTKVELPCRYTGLPDPALQWFDGSQREIIDGEEDLRYRIDPATTSLVIFNITVADAVRGPFHCEVSERFGNESGNEVTVNILDPPGASGVDFSVTQSDVGDSPETHLDLLNGQTLNLTCLQIDPANITALNLEFRWLQDNEPIVNNSNQIIIENSMGNDGYYCCEIRDNSTNILNTYCITIVIPRRGKLDSLPIDSSIQVGRSLELLCTGSARSPISEVPTLEWDYSVDLNPDRVTQKNETGFSYVRITNVQVDDGQEYTCFGRNGKGVVEFAVAVKIREVCGQNFLGAGNAENEEEIDRWEFSGTEASVQEVRNERVFAVSYDGSGPSYASVEQTIDIPAESTSFKISGRMRRSHNDPPMGIPQIRIILEGGDRLELNLPFNNEAWQWVGGERVVGEATTLTVVLTVVSGGDPGQSINGIAYYDDICVSFLEDDGGGDDGSGIGLLIYIAGGAGGGVLLLAVLLLIVVCCCCCKRKKSGAMPMQKMSTKLKFPRFTMRYTKRPRGPMDATVETEAVYEEVTKKNEEDDTYYIDTVDSQPTSSMKTTTTESTYMYETVNRDEDPTYSTASPVSPTDESDGAYLTVLPDTRDIGDEQYTELVPPSSSSAPPRIPLRKDKAPKDQPLGEWELDPISGEVYSYVNA